MRTSPIGTLTRVVPKPLTLPFSYPGSKARLVRKIEQDYPKHTHHVCAFGGAGSEIICKTTPSPLETLNDRDELLLNFWWVLRYYPDELYDRLWRVGYVRDFFLKAEGLLKQGLAGKTIWEKIDLAEAIVICGNQSRGIAVPGLGRSGWGLEHGGHKHRTRWIRIEEILRVVAARMGGVALINYDWRRVLEDFDKPGNLITCDRPYLQSTCNTSGKMYRHEFTEQDHEELLQSLLHLKHASWVLHGYESNLYSRYLKNIRLLSIPVRKSMGAGKTKPIANELVWIKAR